MEEKDGKERSVGIVETQYLKLDLPEGGFKLEKGGVLPEIVVAYERCGKITPENDNVVFVCHALTGDAHVAGMHPEETSPSGWWEGMFGPGKGVDTERYQVICANVLGGCMGTTGPSSVNPATGRPYGSAFPKITMSDIVDVNRLLLKQLGINHVTAVIGGSFGGILVIDWVTRYSGDMDKAIVIASASHMSSQSLAFDLIGRNAIVEDPKWNGGDYYESAQPDAGLTSARQIAHITYLSNDVLEERFGRERRGEWLERARTDKAFRDEMDRGFHTYFQLESYLRYQGSKFCKRFDANSYLHITLALDEYDTSEKFGSLRQAFKNVKAKLLFVSLSGDWLFEPKQSEELVQACLTEGVRVSYCRLNAPSGHDAFLTHIADLKRVVRAFLPPSDAATVQPAFHRWQERHYANVIEMVPEGSRVADLGCGDGALISILREKRGCTGYGVEMDIEQVIKAIASGVDVVTADLDGDLAMIPEGSADIAILSETLQTIRKPRTLMQRILNIAEEALVSFPNFACWDVRLRLLFSGRMPKGRQLPFEWYDTPNIHLFTLKDFLRLCRDEKLRIVKFFCTPRGMLGRLLCVLGRRNFGASRVTVRLTRDEEGDSRYE